MIQLADDRLTFTFPEIARQLRAHVGRQIPSCPSSSLGTRLSAKLRFVRQPAETAGDPCSRVRRSRSFADTVRAQAGAWSRGQNEIEAALRTAALRAAGLHDASFPALTIDFQRTLQIPDDGRTDPLPAGLGAFPLRSLDDFSATAPASWLQRGGVVMPMYQSEALWISFSASYPFAVKIAAGKINTVSGEAWTAELQSEPQNYVVVPGQPWLDGFSAAKGSAGNSRRLPADRCWQKRCSRIIHSPCLLPSDVNSLCKPLMERWRPPRDKSVRVSRKKDCRATYWKMACSSASPRMELANQCAGLRRSPNEAQSRADEVTKWRGRSVSA